MVFQRRTLAILPVGSGANVQASNHRGEVSRPGRHRPQRPHGQLQEPQSSLAKETLLGAVRGLHLQSLNVPGRGHQEEENDRLL